jgi:uncharacterized protein YlxW (UPF0749 family)
VAGPEEATVDLGGPANAVPGRSATVGEPGVAAAPPTGPEPSPAPAPAGEPARGPASASGAPDASVVAAAIGPERTAGSDGPSGPGDAAGAGRAPGPALDGPVVNGPAVDGPAVDGPAADGVGAPAPAGRRFTGAGVMIAVLLAGLGFTLVVQLRNVSDDPTLAAARQEDLVRILSDLQSREQRLQADIAQLEDSQRQLASGVQGGQAALEEATRRADELGILAGSLPATGPGLLVRFEGNTDQVKANAVLDAVQELRGAGAEAMQISGIEGDAVRIVASTYFLDAAGGINVDGKLLSSPYTVSVIGDPQTMRTALTIPGGVVELVGQSGGTVTMDEVKAVEVTAKHPVSTLQYARPVS